MRRQDALSRLRASLGGRPDELDQLCDRDLAELVTALYLARREGAGPDMVFGFSLEHSVLQRDTLETIAADARLARQTGFWSREEKDPTDKIFRWSPPIKEAPEPDGRSLDRLAQRAPAWAQRKYAYAYAEGKSLAQVYLTLRDAMKPYLGQRLVVHLRDAELLGLVLRDAGHLVSFALTSRPLTTEADDPDEALVRLRRQVPSGVDVIHIDTGYKGSIPAWMRTQGFVWQKTLLVSVSKDAYEGVEEIYTGLMHHYEVVEAMEHADQRLEALDETHNRPTYSRRSPAFWARYYGVRDQIRSLEIRTSYHKRKRLVALRLDQSWYEASNEEIDRLEELAGLLGSGWDPTYARDVLRFDREVTPIENASWLKRSEQISLLLNSTTRGGLRALFPKNVPWSAISSEEEFDEWLSGEWEEGE